MSKRAEKAALKLFPIQMGLVPLQDGDTVEEDVNRWKRVFAKIGYEQAEKDVWDRIEKYLSNRNPTDYATVGWILKNIEEYKKKIMEEE